MMSKKNVTTLPVESNPATVAVPEPFLIDLLIDHLLVAHLVIERPVDARPDRVLELLTDHLLNHLFEMEEAILEAAEMVAEELGVAHE